MREGKKLDFGLDFSLTKVSIDTNFILVSIDTVRLHMNRPTHKELSKKIRLAQKAVAAESVFILNHVSMAADAIELGYDFSDINDVLAILLHEIVADYYAGNYPPDKSYARQIKNLELFAFRWICRFFGCEIYFKFALKNEQIWVVSLHEHREI